MTRPGLTVASLLLTTAILFSFSACSSTSSKNRTLVINGAVHVYSTETPPAVYPGSDFIEVLGPRDQVKVQDVKYGNGYVAVKVKLNDGRRGWVFSGESIELK